MLVQLARRFHTDHALKGLKGQEKQSGERASFEAALRRDLASLQFVAYESVVGGAGKRVTELVVTVLTAPLWSLAVGIAVLFAQWRKPRVTSGILVCDECVGYGGRLYKRWRLNMTPPSAEIVLLRAQPEAQSDAPPPDWRITWTELIQRLPEMINVLKGEMSLVGPRPILRQAFEDLRGAGKYYASARPGVVSASDCGPAEEPPALLYRYYAQQWTAALDWRIVTHAIKRCKTSTKS